MGRCRREEIPQAQPIDQHVGVKVFVRGMVPMVQEAWKTVEGPQLCVKDKVLDVPVCVQIHVLTALGAKESFKGGEFEGGEFDRGEFWGEGRQVEGEGREGRKFAGEESESQVCEKSKLRKVIQERNRNAEPSTAQAETDWKKVLGKPWSAPVMVPVPVTVEESCNSIWTDRPFWLKLPRDP